MTHHSDLDPDTTRELDALDAALRGEAPDAEWAALVAAVRADAPPPRGQFERELGRSVQAGFPRARPRWLRRPALPERLLPVLATLACTAALVGVVGVVATGGGDERTTDAASVASVPEEAGAGASTEIAPAPAPAPAPAMAPVPGASPTAEGDEELARALRDAGAPAPAALSDQNAATPAPLQARRVRRVERSTSLALRTSAAGLQEAASGIVRATQDLGGVVETSRVDSSPGGGEASFVLRVPTARLDDALKRFGELADVRRLSQSAEDVTAAFTSTESRLSDARAERRALLKALGVATSEVRIASLRARIAGNRQSVARLEGDLRGARRRTDTARIDVALRGAGAAAARKGDGGPWGPGDAADDALRVLEVLAGAVLVAAAVLVPLALLGALGVLGARATRRRRREAALG